MTFLPSLKNHIISSANSTAVLLTSSATFTGEWESVVNYSTVATAVLGSLATDGTLYFDLSTDGGTTFTSVPNTVGDATFAVPRILNVVESHVRIRYVNGTTAQTGTFALQTKYSNGQELALLTSVDGFVNGETPTEIVRSVTTGVDPNGGFNNIKASGYINEYTTNTPLLSGVVFTGNVIPTEGYSQIVLEIESDQAGSFTAEWYSDAGGTQLTRTFTIPYIVANGDIFTSAPIFAPYVKFTYTNGAVNQTELHLGVKFETKSINGQVLGINSFIAPNMVANLGRNVAVSQQPSGTFKNAPHNGVAFSTNTPLTSGTIYESNWIDTDGYNSIELFIQADVHSAENGIKIEYTDSIVGDTVRETHNYTYGEPELERGYLELLISPKMVGFRVCYVNGDTNQTSFILQSDIKVNGNSNSYDDGGALIVGDAKTEIALNNVPNYSIATKFGTVKLLDLSDAETTVWSMGNDDSVNVLPRKTFLDTATPFYMASSSASDTAKEVTIKVSDASNVEKTVIATLTGQTPVLLGTFLDCNSAYISGDDQSLVGDVFIAGTPTFTNGIPSTLSTTQAHISSAYGRTQQACVRVPTNTKMVISSLYARISRINGSDSSALLQLRVKPAGKSWFVLRPYLITTSSDINKTEQIVLKAGDLVEFTIDEVSDNDTSCNVEFEYQLIKE